MHCDEQYDPARAEAVRRAVQHAARLQHDEQACQAAFSPVACDAAQFDQGFCDATQFDQGFYVMCMMPQAMADTPFVPQSGFGSDVASPVTTPAFQRAATEPSATLGAGRPTAKPAAPALGRKAPLPLAPVPLPRSVAEPAAKTGAAAAEKRASLKDALPHRPTAASMQRDAVKARMLRALAGGGAPLLLAKRKAQQQAARGDHSTLSALNIDGSPGAAVAEARFLAEVGKQLRRSPGEDDEKKLLQASPSGWGTAAPEVDPDASTAAEEDEPPWAGLGAPGFVASRRLLLSYRCLAEAQAPELDSLNCAGGDRRPHAAVALPPGAATARALERQLSTRSEPARLWERQLSTSSSLPGTPFSRARSSQPPSAEELRRREVQSLLNKVCPENVVSVIEKMSAMEVSTAAAMEAVIELIFKKALAEPHYCETYADIVFGLKSAFPEFQSPGDGKPMTFKSSVLNICQHEFEELLRAPEPSEDERAKLDPEQLEYERRERRKRMRANMRFIGHLFLRQLLSAKVIGSVLCELTLVEVADVLPEEHAVECACELVNAVGFTLDSLPAGRAALAAVCGRMHALRCTKTESGREAYSRRVQFAMQDVLDARAAGWIKKVFKTSAKTKEDIRLEQECDRLARSSGAGGEMVVAGQRPLYMSAAAVGA